MIGYLTLILNASFFMLGGMVGRLVVLRFGLQNTFGPPAIMVGGITVGYLSMLAFKRIWVNLLKKLYGPPGGGPPSATPPPGVPGA